MAMQDRSVPWCSSEKLGLGAAVASVGDHTMLFHLAAARAAGRQLANREERPYTQQTPPSMWGIAGSKGNLLSAFQWLSRYPPPWPWVIVEGPAEVGRSRA